MTESTPRFGWPIWIGVVADDLEAQRRFYRDTLGLREISAHDDCVIFDLDGNDFELLRREDVPQYAARRYQVGFAVDDIVAARAVLIAGGATAISEIEGERQRTGRWCYFRDMEGNVFEIKEARPR